MLNEYALLKLQAANGEEHFIHTLPALLSSKRHKTFPPTSTSAPALEVLPLTNIIDSFHYHALLYYSHGHYRLAAITPLLLNNLPLAPAPALLDSLAADTPASKAVDLFLAEGKGSMREEEHEAALGTITRLTVLS
jgi:hypothetical protein